MQLSVHNLVTRCERQRKRNQTSKLPQVLKLSHQELLCISRGLGIATQCIPARRHDWYNSYTKDGLKRKWQGEWESESEMLFVDPHGDTKHSPNKHNAITIVVRSVRHATVVLSPYILWWAHKPWRMWMWMWWRWWWAARMAMIPWDTWRSREKGSFQWSETMLGSWRHYEFGENQWTIFDILME